MIGDLLQRLEARPFQPFLVVMSSGQRYRVATAEHAAISPNRSRVVIWFDNGSGVEISGLHITAIENETAQTI